MWKDFLYYSKAEKRGVIILIVLIIIGIGFLYFPLTSGEQEEMSAEEQEAIKKEYTEFMQSVKEKEKKRANPPYNKEKKNYKVWKEKDWEKPRYHKTTFPKEKDSTRSYIKYERRDSLPKVVKYPEGTIVNINTADTTELKMIPGIGSAIAKMIVNYRKRLGGFYNIQQLEEIENLKFEANAIESWFTVGEHPVLSRINLNKVSIERLKEHPYFNFYQAKEIIEYRKKKGKIKSLRAFELLDEFSEEDLERMGWYVCFE